MTYIPEFKEGDLSPEIVHRLLNSDWRSPANPNRQTKIFIGSAIITDLVTSLFKGERPIIISIFIGLGYILIFACGLYAVYKALKWLILTLMELIIGGAKALCGI